MNIKIYYHLFVPPIQGYETWIWWINDQFNLVKNSGLHHIANVNVCITMPRYWVNANGEVMDWHIPNYIKLRYPFANIIDIRDTGDENIFEGQTLRHLYKHCSQEDGMVFYFHSKGITKNSPYIHDWMKILNHFCITEWPRAIAALDNHDVVGVRDKNNKEDYMVSGNFWWANNSFIRTLPDPLDSTKYQTRPSFYPGGPDYRYSFEDWLWSGKPKVHHLVDTKTNHYDEFCNLEDLIGEKGATRIHIQGKDH